MRLWKWAPISIGATFRDCGGGGSAAALPGTLRQRRNFVLSGNLVYLRTAVDK